MSESKHTPGPWDVDFSGPARLAITGPSEETIARCDMQCENGDVDEANARLIAAAPDLLEACKAVEVWVILATARDAHPEAVDNALADLKMLRAALAKATT